MLASMLYNIFQCCHNHNYIYYICEMKRRICLTLVILSLSDGQLMRSKRHRSITTSLHSIECMIKDELSIKRTVFMAESAYLRGKYIHK